MLFSPSKYIHIFPQKEMSLFLEALQFMMLGVLTLVWEKKAVVKVEN